MYHNYSEPELRSLCRSSIEAMERWARNIIDKKLSETFGKNYFYHKLGDKNYLIKKSVIYKAKNMMNKHPERFKREIDTLFLNEIIDILCRQELYQKCFKEILDVSYPDGVSEVRTFLNRIITIRNSLSHSNPISIREAEKCICYTHDFIDGIKKYYEKIGVEKMFNVPNAIKLNDSLGNEIKLNNDSSFQCIELKDSSGNLYPFQVGDKYSVWFTMDPAFSEDSYSANWHLQSGHQILENNGKSKITIEFTEKMVAFNQALYCEITSKKTWHKYGNYDQQFILTFQVLPPND